MCMYVEAYWYVLLPVWPRGDSGWAECPLNVRPLKMAVRGSCLQCHCEMAPSWRSSISRICFPTLLITIFNISNKLVTWQCLVRCYAVAIWQISHFVTQINNTYSIVHIISMHLTVLLSNTPLALHVLFTVIMVVTASISWFGVKLWEVIRSTGMSTCLKSHKDKKFHSVHY